MKLMASLAADLSPCLGNFNMDKWYAQIKLLGKRSIMSKAYKEPLGEPSISTGQRRGPQNTHTDALLETDG